MPALLDDAAMRVAFSVYENRGVYALLLGSGLSRAAEIPTGWDITVDLIRRVAEMRGEGGQADYVEWYSATTGEEPDYSSVVGELGLSRDERRSILHTYIEPTDEDGRKGRKVPTRAHYAIADLVRAGYVRVIVTTNFDRLIENALRERGVEPTIVASEDALKGAEPLPHTSCFLLKLHGDYKDARILNTDAELSKYSPEVDALLDRIFDEHGLIVCGWSGEWDHALRTAILRGTSRRYSMFWAARSEPGARTGELIAHRDAHRIQITDADAFFGKLGEYVQTLGRTHRASPQSVELLVNSAKRYLEKPEYRIQLDEVISSTAESLIERLDSQDFSARNRYSTELFRDRVVMYEAATEPLARMFGVLGRWGDDSEYGEVVGVLRSVHSRADLVRSGTTAWLNLHTYPVVLLFAAYGVGLVRSQRWTTLHRLFSEQFTRHDGDDTKRAIDTLFLWEWSGGYDNTWKELEGFERQKTPLSDHSCKVLTEWGTSFVGVEDFELLYEKWEILGAIAFSERFTLEHLQTCLSGAEFERVPVGRSGWHVQMRRRILAQIQQTDVQQKLLEAGFANGQDEYLAAVVSNYLRVAARVESRHFI